jgi:hypothetical protein
MSNFFPFIVLHAGKQTQSDRRKEKGCFSSRAIVEASQRSVRKLQLFFYLERGDNFDWEALLDKEAAATKRRITVNELVPRMKKLF